MNEEIKATIQAIYQCPAEVSLTAQSDMIHDDLTRLIDQNGTRNVAMCGVTIQHVQSEAMSYGNTTPRDIPAHQIDQTDRLLRDVYPDAGSIGEALSWILCDLRHLADQENIAFGLWDKSGYRIYAAEKHDAQQQVGQGVPA